MINVALEVGRTAAPEAAMFWILAPVAIIAALGMLLVKKAVHSAILMAWVMITLAIFYIAQGALFLGIVQIVVYTGAVMMLFLFVLMLGVVAVGFSVMQATLVYRGSPVAMRARLLGVLSVCIGTGPIGFFYLGFLADVLTPRVGTVALAAQGMLALLITRRYWVALFRL